MVLLTQLKQQTKGKTMKKLHQIGCALACALMAFSVQAAHNFKNPHDNQLNCKVVGVLDGDTIDCYADGKKQRIRLAEIDAPEKSQPYGQKSKQLLSLLTYGKSVIVTYNQQDKYGRIIGEVFTWRDPISVNYRMVQSGLAWAYERYIRDRAYVTAQQTAKSAKIGLWADKNPIPPEEYRRDK